MRPTLTIAKEFRFEAAHALQFLPDSHPCSRMHGHSYRLVVYLRGPLAERERWVRDFGRLSEIVRENVINRLDHGWLNGALSTPQPTAEAICVWIWDRLALHLPDLHAVEVWETATSMARYEGEQ